MKTLSIVLVVLLTAFASTVATAGEKGQVPAWFEHHMSFLAGSGGRWIADNKEFKGDDEPYDAYGMQWSWGLGKKTLKGRLYAIVDGKDIGSVWEFRVLWHPGEQRAVIWQFGSDGTIGVGTLSRVDDKTVSSEQTFYAPDGTRMRVNHTNMESAASEMVGKSFNVSDDGTTTPRRKYTWRREIPASQES